MTAKDSFTLRNLEVHVIGDPQGYVCGHEPGLAFRVVGENIIFQEPGAFSLYALSALLPLIPAKQREVHVYDWMGTDAVVACPDPNCGAQFRIVREGSGITQFRHSETTAVAHPSSKT